MIKKRQDGDSFGKAQVQARYDHLASRYVRHYFKPGSLLSFEKSRRARFVEERAAQLSPTTVLDLGCGPGYVASRLALRLADSTVLGIDFSDGMICYASETCGKEVKFVQGDVESLALPSDSFELVYALGVLGKSESLDRVLSEAYRVLRTGGYFIFTYPNKRSLSMHTRQLGCILRKGKKEVEVRKLLDFADLRAVLSTVGFQITERYYLTFGSGVFTLPWTRFLSLKLETLFGHHELGRSLAMTTIWIVTK